MFGVIANLGWNLPRFLKQIGCLILVLAGVCVLAFGAFVFNIYFSTDLVGTRNETFAVEEALAVPNDHRFCQGPSNYSRDNPDCYVPRETDLRHCRWWLLEDCRAFKMPDFILSDPVKLGTMIRAMIHPCPYLLARSRREQFTSRLDEICPTADAEINRGPIVIDFVGRKKNVIMRIN